MPSLQQHPEGGQSQDISARTLTASQKRDLRAIEIRTEADAKPTALRLAQVAKQSYQDMLADGVNPRSRASLDKELVRLVLKLLHIKGRSIREMVKILTPLQKKLVREEMAKPDAPGDLSDVIKRTFHLASP